MRRRPTRRALVVTGIGGLLALSGATAQAGWLFVLAAGVLGLVAGSFVVRHGLSRLVIEREAPVRARVGDPVRLGITIANPSRRTVPMFTVEDRFGAFPPVIVGAERLAPGEVVRAEMVATAAFRGRYTSGTAAVASGAPFGLVRSRYAAEIPTRMTVVPNWVELASFPVIEPSLSPSDVVHDRARTGVGEEFLGVREFRPGDPLRAVHWRSSARAGVLVVREFEQEIANPVTLVVAGGDHGDGPASSFETLVSAAASIGLYASSRGHPLHLVTWEDDGPVHLAHPSRNDLLDALAGVAAHDVALDHLVDASLQAGGRRATVVVCAPTAGEAGRSIATAIARARQAGAHAVLVAARSSTWDPNVTDHEIPEDRGARRTIERGRELSACLAG